MKRTMRSPKTLQTLRGKIDHIDHQLLALITERAKVALEVGRFKQERHLEPYAADREKLVQKRLQKLNRGPLSTTNIHTIFREIMSACLALEKPLRVSYLGPEATFSHQAALRQFGHAAEFVQIPTIEGIFREVESRQSDFGVVPIENSTEGSVYRTLDLFMETPLKIVAEIALEVSLYLMSTASSVQKIRKIYSHPHALAECSRWLANNLPDVPVEALSSTAVAAKKAAEDPHAAAIASKIAASIYRLHILKEKIEDHPNNHTRFWVIGHQSPQKSGHDKTSIMFSVKDEVGALYKALYPFYRNDVNITKIESRPVKERPWEYVFFVDLEGHTTTRALKKSLNEMDDMGLTLKILGTYPQST
jgi:chorismate mutase / prephenate dehydratase